MPNIFDLIQAASNPGMTPGFGDQSGQNPQAGDVVVSPEPKRVVAEDTRSEPGPRRTDELVPRKGMFGVKGTLRDVLGLVGDSLLVGSGKQAIYQPVRQQEKLGSAIYGYNDDPQAAIDRTALVDPDTAIQLQGRYDAGRKIDQQIAAQKIAGQQKAAAVTASWANSLTPETYGLARDKLQKYSDQYDLGYDFPQEYDKDFMAGVFKRGLAPDDVVDNTRADTLAQSQEEYRKAQIDLGRRRIAEQSQHNRKMESRQPASRPDHGPSLSNVEAGIATAVANGTATPSQQRYFDQRMKRPEGKGGGLLSQLRGAGGPPPPPNGGSFRKVK